MPLTEGRPPVIVVDGAHGGGQEPAEVGLPVGWSRRLGFDLPESPWDLSGSKWICAGRIDDEAAASAAMSALARGVGLAVAVGGGMRFRLRVLDDLHHNGDVVVGPPEAGHRVELGADDEALLAALAEGATVDEAARAVNLSPRTAHRRLARLRATYGAANTTEAVARWLADR